MKTIRLFLIAAFVCCDFLGNSTFGGEYDSGKEPLILNDKMPSLLTPTMDIRLRYEYGEQDGLDASNAGTLRNRLGILTKEVNGFQAFAEYEGTLAFDRNSYRAASVHGPANKTVIADPESHEVNQAWISYSDENDVWGLKAGRQALNIDGQRYVGGVAWRQNMQTFDAATVNLNVNSDVSLQYSYVWQTNRIFGSDVFLPAQTDFEGNSHLINAKFKNTPLGTLTTYIYSLDLSNGAGDANSNNSFGASLTGSLLGTDANYYAEYAYQTDAYDSPLNYQANYAHANVSTDIIEGIKGTVGLEYLGSDNGVGYKFPLGTNHKFNGFADRFLGTPAGGLTDLYVSAGTTLESGTKLAAFYHYFWDDGFDAGLGQEVDLVISKSLGNGFSVLTKGGFFWGDSGLPDTTRASIEIGYKY